MLDIDLGKACLINMVVVDHGLNQFGYCRQMTVLTSDDGRNWRQQIVVPGLRRVTNALLVSPVLTRYIRLYAVTTGAKGWSLAEVYLN